MKNNFFSNIIHEFRTPLTLILTSTQQLRRQFRRPDDWHHLNVIERNISQLLRQYNQWLDVETHAAAVNEPVGDLGAFMGKIIEDFQERVSAKKIDLVYRSHLSGEFWFDQVMLNRIADTLLADVLKLSSAGGHITVTFEEVDQPNADGVRLMVADSGLGCQSWTDTKPAGPSEGDPGAEISW